MNVQQLPTTIMARIKRIPKPVWFVVGLVMLLLLWTQTKGKGGTEIVAGQGISGTSGGGGGTTDAVPDTTNPVVAAGDPFTAFLAEQQASNQSFLNDLIDTLREAGPGGAETQPGGTAGIPATPEIPNAGLPGAITIPNVKLLEDVIPTANMFTAAQGLEASGIAAAQAAGDFGRVLQIRQGGGFGPSGEGTSVQQALVNAGDQIWTAPGVTAPTAQGPAPSGAGGSPAISDGATMADANTARIAILQNAIAVQTRSLAINTAAGKTSSAAIAQNSLDKFKAELATRTGS